MSGMWQRKGRAIADEDRKVTDPEKARRRTLDRAVRLLAARPRSVAELRRRLLEKAWTDETAVDSVLKLLEDNNFLNDEQFAAELALSRLRQKPQGKLKLRQSLSQRQLSKEHVDNAIDTAFEKLPESDLIEIAIEKRIRIKGRPKTREEVKKLCDHLLRRGFSYDLILSRIRTLSTTRLDDTDSAD